MDFSFTANDSIGNIIVENEGFEGVKRIASVLARDFELVSGKRPAVRNTPGENTMIICATLGVSLIADRLVNEGVIDISDLAGKWECFGIYNVSESFGTNAVLILGSDKRGTIYGMFTLSEYIGVTPYVYFGDVAPVQKSSIILRDDLLQVSKEPSVRYRGFFINDEWPCYGNWVTKHFGDFNTDSYEKIFEFLLRLKGNYLWPAMWTSSFSLDGPGSANEELASIYGVVYCYSHHEPCLRASEEWDKVKGEGTRYGTEWNFATNREGITHYWEDALKRSGKYDNMITIGMRGERDSCMLGPNSTVKENVNLLKNIIKEQKRLINEIVRPVRPDAPLLLAVYKEVEEFYYGNDEIDGLKNWNELDDVICMLCEDNHGQMRTLPTKEMKESGKKFGMYYHLDYHGGPISYEWVDSTPFSKIWEQMCKAYEYGIKDVWIVNVGDLKFHEVPLGYFLAMAYDMDKWGNGNPESFRQYVTSFSNANFAGTDENTRKLIGEILTEYIDINHIRRPEFMNPAVFSPCTFRESDRMLARIDDLLAKVAELEGKLSGTDAEAFYSMIGYSAKASMNNLKISLYAGKNAFYASQGRKVANKYMKLAADALAADTAFKDEWAAFKDGKWDGMQLAAHIGFTKWNEDGARKPVLCTVFPSDKNSINISRKDNDRIYDKVYGAPQVIEINDFCYPAAKEVVLEIASLGEDSVNYEITPLSGDMPEWLNVSPACGTVYDLSDVVITVNRNKLSAGKQSVTLKVTDGDTVVHVLVKAFGFDDISAKYAEVNGVCVIRADHYDSTSEAGGAEFRTIDGLGKFGAGVKAYPIDAQFRASEPAPGLTYRFFVRDGGKHLVRVVTAPYNPPELRKPASIGISINEGETTELTLTDSTYRGGENGDRKWCRAVLDQEMSIAIMAELKSGENAISLLAREPGVVIIKIEIMEYGLENRYSYLGMKETVLE